MSLANGLWLGLAVELANAVLDFDQHRGLLGQARGLGEVGVDLGKVHDRKVELLEFENSKAFAAFTLRPPPRLTELHPALLLQDPGKLRGKAAVGIALGHADAKHLGGTIAPDLVAQAGIVLLVELLFGGAAQPRGQNRGALASAAVGNAEDLFGARLAAAFEQRQVVLAEFGIGLPQGMEPDQCVLELI